MQENGSNFKSDILQKIIIIAIFNAQPVTRYILQTNMETKQVGGLGRGPPILALGGGQGTFDTTLIIIDSYIGIRCVLHEGIKKHNKIRPKISGEESLAQRGLLGCQYLQHSVIVRSCC